MRLSNNKRLPELKVMMKIGKARRLRMAGRASRTLRIGLTGGMGSGKSQVLKFLKEKGVPVVQTDLLGHQLLRDKKFLGPLLKLFGEDVLGENGMIDRGRMADQVFAHPRKRIRVNQLLHPAIRK